jgi:hypothetical protein
MTKKERLENTALRFRVMIANGAPVVPQTAWDALAVSTPEGYTGAPISAKEILAAAKRMGPCYRKAQ